MELAAPPASSAAPVMPKSQSAPRHAPREKPCTLLNKSLCSKAGETEAGEASKLRLLEHQSLGAGQGQNLDVHWYRAR